MSTPCQLATMIETVAPRLDPALVCRDNVESILSIARVLPTWQCAGFECRLGDAAPRADFGVHLRRTHGISIDEALLARQTPDSPESDAWQRLRRFAQAWSERQTVIARAIPAVSLEFDVHSLRPPRVAAPSMFFSMRFGPYRSGPADGTAVDACSRVVRAVLEAVGADMADARHQLEQCFRVLLPRVPFLQLGVWLARPVNTFRICAPGLKLRDIRAVVRALRWSGPQDAYESRWRDLLQFGDRGALHLDVGSEVAAKIGIEVNFGEGSASLRVDDPEDTRFFDYLVEHDMCLPEKRDGLLSWVGGFRLNPDGGDAATAPLFLRTISHVKLVFQPDQNPQAKAYLAVGRIDDRTQH